jgi:hypothetical protein
MIQAFDEHHRQQGEDAVHPTNRELIMMTSVMVLALDAHGKLKSVL